MTRLNSEEPSKYTAPESLELASAFQRTTMNLKISAEHVG